MIKCGDCGNDCTKEYALTSDGIKICYACCAKRDKHTMIEDGHSKRLPLYCSFHTITSKQREPFEACFVSNWPGTLRFKCIRYKQGKHNFPGGRLDVWFKGPDGFIWWGVHYGYMNNIIHCRRTQRKSKQTNGGY